MSNRYDYYHLLSGMCFPIKSMEQIKKFFSLNSGVNYIHYDDDKKSKSRLERIDYYMFFQDIKPRGRSVLSVIQRITIILQKIVGIKRTRNSPYVFKSGSQWWSITHECAMFLINKEADIKRCFKYTMCDEMFVQTMVYNSELKNTLPKRSEKENYEWNLREIDWNRGTPYTYTSDDFNMLVNSPNLFARKFDERLDFEIIRKVSSYIH